MLYTLIVISIILKSANLYCLIFSFWVLISLMSFLLRFFILNWNCQNIFLERENWAGECKYDQLYHSIWIYKYIWLVLLKNSSICVAKACGSFWSSQLGKLCTYSRAVVIIYSFRRIPLVNTFIDFEVILK